MNYTFSLAGYNDIPEIVSLYRGLVGTPGCVWSLEYPDETTARSDIGEKSLYILKENGSVIATASAVAPDELTHLNWKPQNPCELARVGVAAPRQNRGVGTILLKNVISEAKKRGFDGITMLVSKANHAALALYEKNGFHKCGETFMYDNDYYCYQMVFENS